LRRHIGARTTLAPPGGDGSAARWERAANPEAGALGRAGGNAQLSLRLVARERLLRLPCLGASLVRPPLLERQSALLRAEEVASCGSRERERRLELFLFATAAANATATATATASGRLAEGLAASRAATKYPSSGGGLSGQGGWLEGQGGHGPLSALALRAEPKPRGRPAGFGPTRANLDSNYRS